MIAVALAMIAAQATATPDPVAAAVIGLAPAEIEDDNGPDMPLAGASSAGCRVTIAGRDKAFELDMTRVVALSLEDTFVFVEAGAVKLAVVGDASRPDQAAKLAALATAMTAIATHCTAVTK